MEDKAALFAEYAGRKRDVAMCAEFAAACKILWRVKYCSCGAARTAPVEWVTTESADGKSVKMTLVRKEVEHKLPRCTEFIRWLFLTREDAISVYEKEERKGRNDHVYTYYPVDAVNDVTNVEIAIFLKRGRPRKK